MLFPLAALSLLMVVGSGGTVSPLSCAALMGCTFFLHVVIWVQLIQTTVLEGMSPVVAFGIGNVFVTCLQAAGLMLCELLKLLSLDGPEAVSACAVSAAVVLVASVGALLDGESREAPQPEELHAPSMPIASDAGFQAAVEGFSQRCGFSGREAEVFGYFARGRNIPYIAEALVVTPGTVKSHSYHIYQKAGVANRQQLLDLFEAGRERERERDQRTR